ncbi:MAG: TetR/AcrR family transcriptional regulator [Deltaproteobacteria bacterium]|nr:TetR/AcrR family transcriptional regulator [Deltaproteobacteria bacterium]
MPKIIATKEDWINLGYKTFSEEGEKGIIVEKMAIKLKVNKSSFYWHFKTRKHFISDLTMFWVTNATEQIIYLTNIRKTAKEKVKTLVSLIYKKDPYFDFFFFLKRYAQKEKKIQEVIDSIEKKRIEYAKDLLMELGYSKKEASIKSAILYKHFLAYHEIIRYKKQSNNYEQEVKEEINQFIKY